MIARCATRPESMRPRASRWCQHGQAHVGEAAGDGVIEELLPLGVVAVESREERLDITLSPEEEAACGQMTVRRQREFRTARRCAQLALVRLGLPPAPIPIGPHGEPRWPLGVVGSITHCAGYRACALARAHEVAAVGIDAERDAALPRGVLNAITASRRDNSAARVDGVHSRGALGPVGVQRQGGGLQDPVCDRQTPPRAR